LQTPLDIALVRVDNRLVHGQILEAWVPFLKASCIIVVDDGVAGDYFRETVIRMAVPREVEVLVSSVNDFPEKITFHQGSGRKTIVLLSGITDALSIYRLGFRFQKLNIGNIYNDQCRICCTPSVLLNDEDLRDIDGLHAEGVQIELRRVPREKPIDFYDIVQNIKS
jgi:mannose/fructose/N-acetylgalactosamine-specific phosphotransferase system component IIB